MCDLEMQNIFRIVITILELVRYIVPVVLIIFCTVDIFKIIVSKKEEEVKKIRKDIFYKIIYAILIYLVPILVPFILGAVDKIVPMDYDSSWKDCWDYVKETKKK